MILQWFQDGNNVPVSVNVGDKVLLPEFGGTKINFEEKVNGFIFVFTVSGFTSLCAWRICHYLELRVFGVRVNDLN